MKFCQKCGTQLDDDAVFCSGCGNNVTTPGVNNTYANNAYPNNAYPNNAFPNNAYPNNTVVNKGRCVPAFIVGLIGSIFGLFGGMCVSACYSFGNDEVVPLILLVGGSLLGLIGACMCFSKAKVGSTLQLVAAILIAICVFGITGADFATLAGMLLLGVGGLVGLLMSK